jgi:AcrR family transcriptional regulator
VPKLWATTIETHRQEVRAAVVHAVAALIAEHGLSGVTMSAIATKAGIGRATLYKYFPDVDSILAVWHQDQVAEHVARLREISQGPGKAEDRLKRALLAYAEIKQHARRQGDGSDLMAALHSSTGLQAQHDELRAVLGELVEQAVLDGDIRDDIPPTELAAFALSAAAGATLLRSRAATARLIQVTMDALTHRSSAEHPPPKVARPSTRHH